MPPSGLILVTKALLALILPSVGSYTCIHFLDREFSIQLPPVATYALLLSSIPFSFFSRFLFRIWKNSRDASRLHAESIKVIPGRWPGNLDVMMYLKKSFMTGYTAEEFQLLAEKFGNIFTIRVLWVDSIFTTEPEHIKQILATEFHNFEKGDNFISLAYSVLGVGVFNSDGDMWKFHRSMTRPFFSRERISHFDIFARHSDEAIMLMKQRFSEGYALDIQDLLGRFTLDSATEFLFGRCVHVLRSGLPYPHNAPKSLFSRNGKDTAEKFSRAFAEAQAVIAERSSLGPVWPLLEVFNDKSEESMKIVRAFLDPIIEEAVEKRRMRKLSPMEFHSVEKKDDLDDGETLLDHLVKLTDDQKILKDEILNITVAGRDTTAATLTFATYLLSMHPDVLKKLRCEILDRVGSTKKPTYDDIREMKYLRAVINETLRLFPPVPFDVRQSINGTTFVNPSGGRPWYIPAHTGITYSAFMMHRRTDLWGPDAQDFDPGRFLDYRLHKYLTPNPFIFLPFNAGPRICLGQQFAYNEISFMLIRMLQTFNKFELDPSAQPPDSRPPAAWKNAPGRQAIERIFPKAHLTMYSYKGLWVRMGVAEMEN